MTRKRATVDHSSPEISKKSNRSKVFQTFQAYRGCEVWKKEEKKGREGKIRLSSFFTQGSLSTNERTFHVRLRLKGRRGRGVCCNHVTHTLQDEATGFDIGLKLYSNCSFLPKDFHGRILGGEIGNKNMIFQAFSFYSIL